MYSNDKDRYGSALSQILGALGMVALCFGIASTLV